MSDVAVLGRGWPAGHGEKRGRGVPSRTRCRRPFSGTRNDEGHGVRVLTSVKVPTTNEPPICRPSFNLCVSLFLCWCCSVKGGPERAWGLGRDRRRVTGDPTCSGPKGSSPPGRPFRSGPCHPFPRGLSNLPRRVQVSSRTSCPCAGVSLVPCVGGRVSPISLKGLVICSFILGTFFFPFYPH